VYVGDTISAKPTPNNEKNVGQEAKVGGFFASKAALGEIASSSIFHVLIFCQESHAAPWWPHGGYLLSRTEADRIDLTKSPDRANSA
jgi:hypothetical protein